MGNNLCGREHIFNRSGIASLSDLQAPDYKDILQLLEKYQDAFLLQEYQFRSREYIWPRDPLHTWSRVWEYPYVYHHLKDWRSSLSVDNLPRVVDVGSGVTFFPFSVARLGCYVTCTDMDVICKRDLERAIQFVSVTPGQIDFRLTDGITLPFGDSEVDAVYCISVLEHAPNFEKTISEIARILKPGGLSLITIDIDLRGDFEIGVETHKRLKSGLCKYFDYLFPETIIHPRDMINSETGPYGFKKIEGLSLVWFIIKQNIIKPILRKNPIRFTTPYYLAVQGFSLIKK
jgi:2-polyprenyl-3-methyl-5-hydroxy-6-metoxy-1,4-benzoquinol methylase